MKELYADAGIEMINIVHTNPAAIDYRRQTRRRVWKARRKRNLAITGFEITALASLALNIIQSVVIYILQAGPV